MKGAAVGETVLSLGLSAVSFHQNECWIPFGVRLKVAGFKRRHELAGNQTGANDILIGVIPQLLKDDLLPKEFEVWLEEDPEFWEASGCYRWTLYFSAEEFGTRACEYAEAKMDFGDGLIRGDLVRLKKEVDFRECGRPGKVVHRFGSGEFLVAWPSMGKSMVHSLGDLMTEGAFQRFWQSRVREVDNFAFVGDGVVSPLLFFSGWRVGDICKNISDIDYKFARDFCLLGDRGPGTEIRMEIPMGACGTILGPGSEPEHVLVRWSGGTECDVHNQSIIPPRLWSPSSQKDAVRWLANLKAYRKRRSATTRWAPTGPFFVPKAFGPSSATPEDARSPASIGEIRPDQTPEDIGSDEKKMELPQTVL